MSANKKKIKYPIITKENFEEVVNKLFVERRIWNESWDNWDYYDSLRLEPPKNLKEFREATKNLYGVELKVDCLAYPLNSFGDNHNYACKYQIRENQDEYSKGKVFQLWEKRFGEYDGLKLLLNLTFGNLFCGGVAGHHYGQTRCSEKTWRRIKNWDKNNKAKVFQAALKQRQELRKALY